jgi:hypothetical protein
MMEAKVSKTKQEDGLGQKPELRWIKLTQLYIPTEYQRSVRSDASAKNINYIKNHFNWADCGALIVCPLPHANPPQYAVIDGQHRFRAAESHGGIDELPCVVIGGRGASEQARNFVTINSKRVKLHPLQEYQAAVVAGEPDAVALQAILDKCGVTMAAQALNIRETHPRCTLAVGTLLKMIQDYSEKQITWVLTVIPEAYGDKTGMLRANLIRVLAQFRKANPDADRAAMVAALRRLHIDDLEKDARIFREIDWGTMAAAMFKVLERKYKAKKAA